MMRQYWELKAQYKDSLLFFRLGDFYELFFEDAERASRILGLTLTSREGGGDVRAPMCGVPHHAAETHIGKLLKQGLKVALCEQVEDPRKAKGLVRRDVVRIFTPGTVLESGLLDEKANNYIAAVAREGRTTALAIADLSTGEFRTTCARGDRADDEIGDELKRLAPSECVVVRGSLERMDGISPHVNMLEEAPAPDEASRHLRTHFGTASLEAFGCADNPAIIQAASLLVSYVERTNRGALALLKSMRTYERGASLRLDPFTLDALEVVAGPRGMEGAPTLLRTLDRTVTAPGGRMLKSWLISPLKEKGAIVRRLDAVEWMVEHDEEREFFRQQAGHCPDLERIAARVASGTAGARDLGQVREGLRLVSILGGKLGAAEAEGILAELAADMRGIPELEDLLGKAIVDDPPVVLNEGDIIRDGYNAEIDGLRGVSRGGKEALMELQNRERRRTGIETLKVQYNNVFGYFIEVSRGKAHKVPADYLRKQTLSGAERYTTPELKELEAKVLGAHDRLCALEFEVFNEVRKEAAKYADAILRSGRNLGSVDALASFAEVSAANDYTRPVITTEWGMEVTDGRHPVLERMVSPFVSNDIRFTGGEEQVLVITGPNMAGKSTYLRQCALIALMAHTGCFVSAKSASIGVMDGIYCRIGASDRITAGKSTFMVEMTEVAHILNHATERSLLVFDEVGRGTSTYDGISIAWAMIEHIAGSSGAMTLFATHYYELTSLAGRIKGVKNLNVLVREWKNELVFLYKIVPGRADRSYGVQVARLAGLPGDLLGRARELLNDFEKSTPTPVQGEQRQMTLFGDATQEVAKIIDEIDPDNLTPVQALAILVDLRERLRGSGAGNA